ncbi:DUF916 domain-containing protein [Agromyces intestinalis]|uniref:DUF916 domain-containing protein n=1 Tax=Agromyces intestinalis TaxID=2592652 RepID=A0A5C1YGT5_9MICO|nr:DUF916 domain-containing protein [Agromyces intestinalis]QEO13972.1 DUF916 domain-containing protein [Agromyces intestinalis]
MSTTNMTRRAAAAAAITTLLMLGGGVAAHAEEVDEAIWGVQPSSEQGPDGRGAFEYTLGPGETVTDYVGVSNLGAAPISVKVYAMDATTTADGAFTLPPAGTESEDVGAWVGVGGDEVFEIAPGTRLDIPFRLTVPPDVSPGDHAGGIVAALSELSATGDGAQQVAVDRRVGARIYVTVPGEQLPALDVRDVTIAYDGGWNLFDGTANVTYTLANSGNMRVGGESQLVVDGPFGWRLGEAEAREQAEILPGASVRVEEQLTGIIPALLVFASVELTPGLDGGAAVGGEHLASGTGWAIPYPVALVALLLLGIAGFAVAKRIRRAKAARPKAREPEPEASDSVPEPVDDAAGDDDAARRDLVDAR